ncbi:MAG: HEAT repeat domain-containing protein [Phycisphaerae bacterium]|nr:HEAT repeat domain-containing protein [Phycisphaerae bacterium]
MRECVLCHVMLTLLYGAWICNGQASQEVVPNSTVTANLEGLSGLFLRTDSGTAISVPVKFVFQRAEPATYEILPDPEVPFSDMRFARAGALFQPGGHVDLARNRYEKNNLGYYTHLYLKTQASQRLAQAMTQHKTDVVLVISGIGKGRVEPVDLQTGHWAVANIKGGGPGGHLSVTLNTHIMIAWANSGLAPKPSNSDRQEVEYSLKEYMYQYFWQMGGNGIGGAITAEDFARTGDIGAALYADFVDSEDTKKALIHQSPSQTVSTMARSFAGNLPPSMQATVFEHVKGKEFRRALVCDSRFPSWALNNNPGKEKYQAMLLTDEDPLIVAVSFVSAAPEAVQVYRTKIIESLNTCFAETLIPSVICRRLFERIASETLIECAPALAHYMMQPVDAGIVEPGIQTLGQLRAYQLLGDIIMSRPVTDQRQLRRAFRYFRWTDLNDQEANQKSAVLVKLSDSALAHTWTDAVDAHKLLVSAMVSFIGVNGRAGPSQERIAKQPYHHVRHALHAWIDTPGGVDVLARLASSASMPSEAPFFIKGLKHPDVQTAAACIAALSRLGARDAMPALIAVFDRPDALADLHAAYRAVNQEGRMPMAISVPPYERDTIGCKADEALFHLAGGQKEGLDPVPPFTDSDVLDQRRDYWKTWLQSHPPRMSRE